MKWSGALILGFSIVMSCGGENGGNIPSPAPAPSDPPAESPAPAPTTDPAPTTPAPPAPPPGRWDPSVGTADCAAAWGTAGEKLSACDKTKKDYVVVHKSKRNVALCSQGKLVKNYESGLGFAPTGTKMKQGDGKTPEGVFYVARLLPDSDYYKAFLFSYPTKADADRGLKDNLITQAERNQIYAAHDACQEPPQDTGLGGAIEIHGKGGGKDWTLGCVAMDDANVDALWAVIARGDTIVVVP
jgi:hypothetical protein